MGPREKGKQENRKKIVAMARKIIEKEGVEALSMRRLADDAGVALRTPYNLFGSKARILMTLLGEGFEEMFVAARGQDEQEGVIALLNVAKVLEGVMGTREPYFRAIYWEVMTADEQEPRDQGVQLFISILRPLLQRAHQNRELQPEVEVDRLNRHLSLVALGLIGMWAGRQLAFDDMFAQVRRSWLEILLVWSRGKTQKELKSALLVDAR